MIFDLSIEKTVDGKLDALTAENERLREALKEIEEFAAIKYRPHSLVGLDWEHVNNIASAALAKA